MELLLGCESLKGEFGRDLQRSRSAASQERIADPNVAGGGEGEGSTSPPRRNCRAWTSQKIVGYSTVRSGVGDEAWQIGIRKVWMIQKVIRFEAKFQLQALRDRRILENGKVKLTEMRSNE